MIVDVAVSVWKLEARDAKVRLIFPIICIHRCGFILTGQLLFCRLAQLDYPGILA